VTAAKCLALAALALGLGTCAPVEPVALGVPSDNRAPEIRIALARAASALEVGGGMPLLVLDETGATMGAIPAGTLARAVPLPNQVVLQAGGVRIAGAPSITLEQRDGGTVRVAGREYRGRLLLTATSTGLLAVNALDLEDYVAGVINAEMGRRAPGEEAALEVQAIVSRTFAYRVLGRWRTAGFDLVATIADQAYGGQGAETDAGRAAVESTRGVIITWNGQPIEAFFHSTCGGRTTPGQEAFANAGLPYLVSVSDDSPSGESWCVISPRYRWREEWTGEALRATLRATLPPLGVPAERVGLVRDVVVTERGVSGRVTAIRIMLSESTVPVTGQTIRSALRPEGGTLLRSTGFQLEATKSGGRLTRLVVEGKGNGHGVGMCQWGAVGRARAGYSAEQILSAYYPGTVLSRAY
jgi:stage II sporulation protein D